ncbi:MAG: YybH family protein [Gemmatimonadales bacterium]
MADATTGAAQTAADRRSAAEVRALFERFNEAWERRDAAFVRTFYAHDPTGVFFFERRQLHGWPLVDSLYQTMFASAARGRVHSRFEVLDVGARGNLAWLAANFRLEVIEPAGDTTVDEGRQSLVFERRGGRWAVVHRHTSFQAPPGPQRLVPRHTTAGPLWSPADDTTGGPDARAIRALRQRSNDAIARHDTAGIGASFAPGVVVVASTSSVTVGREANLASFAGIFAERPDVIYRRTPVEVRVDPRWRMASEQGRWTGRWTAADGPVSIGGSYFAKWREIDGAWRIESETFVPERCTGGEYCRTPPR